jgi:peptidoglycan/xylan/chitin deacetylase (PgdA/CDA1 family)
MRAYYPKLTWLLPNNRKEVYITFDDGPTPQITDWVLNQLEQYNAKATFFLIGKNVAEHPEIFQQLKHSPHRLGNHTYNHLNGWKNNTQDYLNNFDQFEKQYATNLFRPPYGKIKKAQLNSITPTHRIIMWDIITYDFDKNLSPEQCFNNVVKYVRPGSIVVFHDSVKAWPRLQEALPQTLQYLKKEGYLMEAIP